MWRRRKYKIIRKMKTEARGNVFLYNLSMFVTLRVRLADSNPQMLEWRTSVVPKEPQCCKRKDSSCGPLSEAIPYAFS